MSALENVVCARAFTHEQQSALINEIAARMAEDQFALLIVDSFTALFRVDFLGREELAARQQAIASMMNKLTKLATEFNIAVFITKYVIRQKLRAIECHPSGLETDICSGNGVEKTSVK